MRSAWASLRSAKGSLVSGKRVVPTCWPLTLQAESVDSGFAGVHRFALWQDLHADARLVVDESGAVVEAYACDVFGACNVAYADGAVCDGSDDCPSRMGNPIRFAGARLLPTSGLLHMRARDYDPVLRTFLSRDPIPFADGFDPWRYAAGDPLNLWDPLGLAPQSAEARERGRGKGRRGPGRRPDVQGAGCRERLWGTFGCSETLAETMRRHAQECNVDPNLPHCDEADSNRRRTHEPGDHGGEQASEYRRNLARGVEEVAPTLDQSFGEYLEQQTDLAGALAQCTDPETLGECVANVMSAWFFFGRFRLDLTPDGGGGGGGRSLLNRAGQEYPRILHPGTGEIVPHPGTALQRVPVAERVPWGRAERGAYITEWYERGLPTPEGGWSRYDIHHILPREYGGTNAFENLVPVDRMVHQTEFNTWWRDY